MEAQQRTRLGMRAAGVSVVLNLCLALVKGALGTTVGSVGLLADAFHSLTDAFTSIVVLIGFRIAGRPPDPDHPFGHGRAEHVATLLLATLLAIAAYEFAKVSIQRMLTPVPLDPPIWMLAVLLLTIGVKEGLFWYANRLGRRIDSDALRADAWHHRSDSLSTALVLVGLLGGRLGAAWLDPVAGLGVAALMGWLSFGLLRKSVSTLLGEAPTRGEVREIVRLAGEVEGVSGVHDVIVHRYGVSRWVSLHVEIPGDLSARDVHAVSEEVERRLAGEAWGSVVVHADPVCEDHPLYGKVQAFISDLVERDPAIVAFQDLRLVESSRDSFKVILDLVVPPGTSAAQQKETRRRFGHWVEEAFPHATPVVGIRPAISTDS